jgi:hypothetical protein
MREGHCLLCATVYDCVVNTTQMGSDYLLPVMTILLLLLLLSVLVQGVLPLLVFTATDPSAGAVAVSARTAAADAQHSVHATKLS